MNNVTIKNIVRFLLLVAFQVLLLNKMSFFGFIIPFVYVLFIILLPLRTNKLLMLFLAFAIGFTIDFFGSTPGLHSSATLLLAFVRPTILNLFFGNIEFVKDEEPNISKLGFFGFFRYALFLVLIHHFTLFMLETLDFSKILMVLKTTLLSSLATMLLIYIYIFLFTKRGK
jgi:hypothetical protein